MRKWQVALYGKVPIGNLRVNGKIILKCIVNKYFLSVEWILLAQNKDQRG